ncbi:MAG: prepilin-type N-terminal cleavage/methylation domain-containing protein [Acidobacteria bacterium]|nr:prepilin-type N-terminal cleavage/methylation domain-containing protein [Acidobacteriota bacterium]
MQGEKTSRQLWLRLSALCSTRNQAREAGFTLLELIITLLIISILAAGAVPVARNLMQKERERELKRTLIEIRAAIDKFKRDCDDGVISKLEFKNPEKHSCYPESLEMLYKGVQEVSQKPQGPQNLVGFPSGKIRQYLRRIPTDPMTGKAEWGMRSIQDDPTSTSWGEENVFDVYSLSPGKSLDGKSYYRDW